MASSLPPPFRSLSSRSPPPLYSLIQQRFPFHFSFLHVYICSFGNHIGLSTSLSFSFFLSSCYEPYPPLSSLVTSDTFYIVTRPLLSSSISITLTVPFNIYPYSSLDPSLVFSSFSTPSQQWVSFISPSVQPSPSLSLSAPAFSLLFLNSRSFWCARLKREARRWKRSGKRWKFFRFAGQKFARTRRLTRASRFRGF